MGEAAIIPEGLNVCLGRRTMLLKPIPDYVLTKYLLLSIMDPRFKKKISHLSCRYRCKTLQSWRRKQSESIHTADK
jgi:hypothetical protein